MAALPRFRRGRDAGVEAVVGDRGPAGPADREFGLVHHTAVGAVPARAEEAGELAGPDAPVDPREDDPADEKDEECAGQEVVHGPNEFSRRGNIG